MKNTLILFLLSCFLPLGIYAQIWNQVGQDIEGDAAGDNFGFALSLDDEGNTVAIGANRNNANGEEAGQIKVMDWDGLAWTQRGTDLLGSAAGDFFGHQVCINGDGTIVAVGAQLNDEIAEDAGQVRVFIWENNQWTQMGSNLNGVEETDYFGQSVRLSNDGRTLAIAGSGFGVSRGVMRVYNWNGADWEQMGMDIVGEEAGDLLNGGDLSADGLTVIAGSWKNDFNGTNSGQVRVFEWDGQAWQQKGASLYGDAEGDHFGVSVRVSSDGNIVAMAAPMANVAGMGENTGYVKVVRWNGTEWVQMGNNINGEGAENLSGARIAINNDGSKLIIGAILNNDAGAEAGHARVYKFENENWVQEGEDIDGENAGDWAGFDVDINGVGDVIAVGARFNEENGDARIFGDLITNLNEPTASQIAEIFPNPTNGLIHVKLEEDSNTSIKVYSVNGKLLYEKNNLRSTVHSFNLEASAGLYLMEISTKGSTERIKIVKN